MQSCYRQHCWCTQLLQSALFEAKEHCTASCSDILAQPRDIQEISARDIPARRRDIGENLQLLEPGQSRRSRQPARETLEWCNCVLFKTLSLTFKAAVWSESDHQTAKRTQVSLSFLFECLQAEENGKKVEEKIDRHSESLGIGSNNVAVAITINQGHIKKADQW